MSLVYTEKSRQQSIQVFSCSVSDRKRTQKCHHFWLCKERNSCCMLGSISPLVGESTVDEED